MDTNPLVIAVLSLFGGGAVLKLIVNHLLNRGKVRIDQAYQIREELREEIKRKNREIDTLDKRIDVLEADLEKAEHGRIEAELRYKTYRLQVYQALLEAGVGNQILTTVLTL